MNRKICLLVAAFVLSAAGLWAQGTAFYYQGVLNQGGSPATGNFDFTFSLYDAPTNGNLISVPQTNLDLAVNSGLFATNLNFGAVFTGTNYWLAIGVRTNGSTNAFTVLQPLQPLLPVPYAIFANSASNLLGNLAVSQLAGTLTSTQLAGTYSSPVSFTNNGNVFSGTYSGTFSGNGANLTALNGSQVTSGTVADARLSSNVAFLNGNQTFTGTNTFTNWNNSFTGNFFGNGLVGWVPVSVTATQAVRDTGYLLLSPSLTTVTLPPTNALQIGDIVRISDAGTGGWLAQENSYESILGNFSSYKNYFMALSSAPGNDWRSVAAAADGSLMYAGGNFSSGVYSSTTAGQTWSQALPTSISGSAWYAMACSQNGNIIYVASYGGGIYFSTNNGSSWLAISGSAANWTGIACNASGSQFIASENGYLGYWNNNALTAVASSKNWSAVASSSDGTHLAAAVSGGQIYTWSSSVGTWNPYGNSAAWSALFMSANGSNLVGAIRGGGIQISTNFGVNWTASGAPTANWSCLSGSSDGSELVAGVSNGLLYASANFGATWAPITTTNQDWTGVAVSANGSRFVATVGTIGSVTGGIYYSGTGSQLTTTSNAIGGGQGTAVELQYIGGGQFMPVSSSGAIWAN